MWKRKIDKQYMANTKQKSRKYVLDATGFFKCMKDNHITWLQLSIEAESSQNALSKLKNGMNIESYTFVKLIASLEDLIGYEIDDVNTLFKFIKRK